MPWFQGWYTSIDIVLKVYNFFLISISLIWDGVSSIALAVVPDNGMIAKEMFGTANRRVEDVGDLRQISRVWLIVRLINFLSV